MAESLVTIIIPVYNVEKYLKEALESAVNQTYENIEIICVNDGSTDNSAQILYEYASKDTRIKIITQNNQGLSGARNSGLAAAKGEYIYFLDSDDFYDVCLVEKTLPFFSDKVDIVSFNMEKFYEVDHRKDSRDYTIEDCGERVIDEEIFEKIFEESPRNVFKNSIIQKYNLKFADKLLYEDTSFILNYLSVANKIYIMPEKLYNYRIRDNSIMHTVVDEINTGHRLKNLIYYEKFLKTNKLNRKDNPDEFIYKVFSRFYIDIKQCGRKTRNRLSVCKDAHIILKNYKINQQNKYLKRKDICILNLLKSNFWAIFILYYKLNFLFKKINKRVN